MMDRRKRRIFVSYAREDRDFVNRRLLNLAEYAPDLEFLVDEKALRVGDSLYGALSAAINNSDAILVIASDKASENHFIRSEVALALAAKRGSLPILTFLLGSDQNIPFLLRDRLWIKYDPNEGINNSARKIAYSLHSLLSEPSHRLSEEQWVSYVQIQRDTLQKEMDNWRETSIRRMHISKLTLATFSFIVLFGLSLGIILELPIAMTGVVTLAVAGIFVAGYLSGYTKVDRMQRQKRIWRSERE
jgi:hypothetical protein